MPGILLFSEKDDLALNLLPRGIELAGQLGTELKATVLGTDARNRAIQYTAQGVSVYVNDSSLLTTYDSRVYCQALYQIVSLAEAETVLLVATKRGREVTARLAQVMGAGCVTNALDVEIQDGKLVTSRYGLGGNTIIRERIEGQKKVIAVLPQTFERAQTKAGEGQIVEVELKLDRPDLVVVERKAREKASVDIEKADVLVCIGRGLKRKEDIGLIQELAGKVGGEIGCTRELASNLGWLPEDRVVGMSGKRCQPKLAFSIGISGQSQHMAGIAGARTIVAINTDRNAPVFKAADYGIVGDLYQVVPKLSERIRKQT